MQIRSFELPWPAYACDWCPTTASSDDSDPFALLAVATFTPSPTTALHTILLHSPDSPAFLHEPGKAQPVKYVASMAKWCPQRRGASGGDLLAVAGHDVSLFRSDPAGTLQHVAQLASSHALKRSSIVSDGVVLPNSVPNAGGGTTHGPNPPAPITAIDWSPVDPSLLLTASYDTTCTVWNVDAGQIKTQLIAHDKEVFDVAFSPIRPESFVSVGAEGSLRLFDTRNLDHSTILYESRDASPLVRVEWNGLDARYLACFGLDSSEVFIVDTRAPAVPVAVLGGHSNVSAVRWAPHSSGHLMSSDDGMVGLWDLSRSTTQPSWIHETGTPVLQVMWPSNHVDHVAILTGSALQLFKI